MASETELLTLLPAETLQDFRARAAAYDLENRFFTEDLEDLRETGYLAAAVPVEMGGAGLSLAELTRAQRRLAAHAPATALGINMHLVWTQVARFLHDRGDERLDWVLEDAAAGEIFAFGISEAGNTAVLLDSFTSAAPDGAGGYRVSGAKVFTTLSPVWTRLGLHARDSSDPENPRVLFGFVRREGSFVRGPGEAGLGLAGGSISHPDRWNPLGMRATQSWNTHLDEVPVAAADVAGSIAPFEPSDRIVLGIFSAFSTLTAAVYAGIADRSLELARAAANRQAGPDPESGIRLDDPDTAAWVTGAVLDHRAGLDSLELIARDVDERAERDDWFLALAAVRNRVCDSARRTVDTAMRLCGSRAAYQADAELARLYRDVAAGQFHPSSSSALARTVRGTLVD